MESDGLVSGNGGNGGDSGELHVESDDSLVSGNGGNGGDSGMSVLYSGYIGD